MALTPNVRKLVVERMATLQIERAKARKEDWLFGAVLAGLTVDNLKADARAAQEWVTQALRAIRLAPDGGQYQTDEDAAAAVLKALAARKGAA